MSAMHSKFIPVFPILFLAALFSGCGGNSSQSANNLPIPPLGTKFEYSVSGVPVEWSIRPHPRIFVYPSMVQFWKDQYSYTDVGKILVDSADEQLKLMESDKSYHEALGPVFFTWAYLIHGDGKYRVAVKNSLSWLTKFPPIVKAPESDNDPFLRQAFALAAVYDLLYNELEPDEKVKIEKALRETAFHTLAYKVTTYDKTINVWANNIYSGDYVRWFSTAGLVAIALSGVEPDANDLANLCYLRLKRSMDVIEKEHGWREGLDSLDYSWGQYALYFLQAVDRNSSMGQSNDIPAFWAWYCDSAVWPMWGELPNNTAYADFGDSDPGSSPAGSYLRRIGAITGVSIYGGIAMGMTTSVSSAADVPIFVASTSGLIMDPPAQFGTWKKFDGIEWGVIRDGLQGGEWMDPNDFYLAFKSGISGYDHNHIDQGSMILAAYGQTLLSDPGKGNDVIRRDPKINNLFKGGIGHNTLIVGDGFYPDLGYEPDNPKYFSRPGKILSNDETDQYIQFTTDNSGLYPTEPLTTFHRTFLYIKPGVIQGDPLGCLVVCDRVIFRTPTPHSILFHTPGTVEQGDTGHAKLINGGARLDYVGYCSVPSVDKVEKQETGIPSSDSTCYYRSVQFGTEGSDWIHVLTPAHATDPDSPAPEFKSLVYGVDVVWKDYHVVLVVNPDKGWIVSNLPGS